MINNSSALAEPTLDFGDAAFSESVGGVVYDTLGMPMSLRAARLMTKSSLLAALDRTLAQLHHEVTPINDPSALIDSMEVVFLIGRFYRALDRKALDLSKVERSRWSSLEGVAEVLNEAMQGPA